MKRTLIMTLIVLACALAVCAASMLALDRAVDGAEALMSEAVLAAEEARFGEAGALMVSLAQYWEDRAGLLETLASHDALHDVGAAIAEAQICLECQDQDDFLRAMSTVAMGLSHLRDEEALRLSNLY